MSLQILLPSSLLFLWTEPLSIRGFPIGGENPCEKNEIIVRGKHSPLRIVLSNENNKGVFSEGRELALVGDT